MTPKQQILLTKLQQQPEFSALSLSELTQIANRMQFQNYQRGELLFEQGMPRKWFYFVMSGLVRLFHRNVDGLERFYAFRHRGGVLPLVGMLTNNDYAYVAEASTTVEVAAIPMSCYEQIVRANPAGLANLVRSMGAVIDLTENELQLMVTNNAKERLRQAIWFVAQQIGEPDSKQQRVRINYPIAITEWAQISATSRETASQVLQKLKQQGQITYERKYLTILDADLAVELSS
ncbi:Crp/Fnr family transcriptional regulator [Lentilactobacillus senioris]|uniref:Crp/Fnr family transcriptional regulator n=1 Tax=Lentilactobacillus senioris TaxID=931534 RepID=UPI0022820D43|nr:Crp/Fnr family transcriptional regulator [Lentilactobacillus senioris]MCY9806291.1 Crp/Fnr family transcriptional regulator [Lentilactobacillus senioris]